MVLIGGLAQAQAFQGELFTVEQAVEDRHESTREQAAKRGLERLIGRLSGDYGGLDEEHRAYPLLAKAGSYLEGYRYINLDGGLGVELRFDADALKSALGEFDVAIWGGHRRPLLLWAAADFDGQRVMLSERESAAHSAKEVELLQTLQREARRRGLPLMFPLLDWRDRASLGYVEIWGGFAARIRQASARYGGPRVVGVALRQTATGAWQASWTALLGEKSLRLRSGPAPLAKVVEEGFDLVGKTLIERYAVVPGEGGGRQIKVVVLGVDRVGDYSGLLRRLQQVDGVGEIQVVSVEGRRVMLELLLKQNEELVFEGIEEVPELSLEPLPTVEFDGAGGRAARAYRWQEN